MRLLINLAIAAGWLVLFNALKWINVTTHAVNLFTDPTVNTIAVYLILAAIFTLALYVAGLVYVLFVLVTCGLGCILLPVYYGVMGFIGFWAINQALPNWLSITTHSPWVMILMGLLIGLVHTYSPTETAAASSKLSQS